MERARRKEDLIRFLRTIQRADLPFGQIEEPESLVEAGLIDSLALLEIVLYLERTYGIDFLETGVNPDHFVSIASILDLIERETAFSRVGYHGYEDRSTLRPTLAWLDRALSTDQPFLLVYLSSAGHHPYWIPSGYPYQSYPQARTAKHERYLNLVHYVDDFLADLFHEFEIRDLMSSTLFLLIGDHGEAFGEHGQFLHANVAWDEVLRIPGLIYFPSRFPTGRRIKGLRQQIDVLPTITNALGFALSGGYVEGYDLLGDVPDRRRLYFASWQRDQWLAYRQGAMKRIYWYRKFRPERYDLARDPTEQANLVDEDAAAGLASTELDLLRWAENVSQSYR